MDVIRARMWAMGQVRRSQRMKIYSRDNYRCVRCNKRNRAGVILTIDHIIPRSKGGSNALSNLQTMCHDCNRDKGEHLEYRQRFAAEYDDFYDERHR